MQLNPCPFLATWFLEKALFGGKRLRRALKIQAAVKENFQSNRCDPLEKETAKVLEREVKANLSKHLKADSFTICQTWLVPGS